MLICMEPPYLNTTLSSDPLFMIALNLYRPEIVSDRSLFESPVLWGV